MVCDGIALGIYPSAELSPQWPQIAAMLETAASRGRVKAFDPGDTVWVAIERGEIIAAATTQMIDSETAELMHVAGQGLRRWVGPWGEMICEWAKAQGARRIVTRGRPGWVRFAQGWRVTGTRDEHGMVGFEKALSDGQ